MKNYIVLIFTLTLLFQSCGNGTEDKSETNEIVFVDFPKAKFVVCGAEMDKPFEQHIIELKQCSENTAIANISCENNECKSMEKLPASSYFNKLGYDVGGFGYDDLADLELLIEASSGSDKEKYKAFQKNLIDRLALEERFAMGRRVTSELVTRSSADFEKFLKPFKLFAPQKTPPVKPAPPAEQPKHFTSAQGMNHDGIFTGGQGGASSKAHQKLNDNARSNCYRRGFTSYNFLSSPSCTNRKESYVSGSSLSYMYYTDCSVYYRCVGEIR
jgi:hypothetical protein